MEQMPLPAVLKTTLDDRWKLSPPNWMDERLRGTQAYYPHALISYYHWKEVKFKFPEDSYIFGDSGGFSVMTLGAKEDPLGSLVDPREVIRWQIKNTTVGVILDVPPRDMAKRKGKSAGSDLAWKGSVEKTARNAKLALPQYLEARKKGSPFRWWGVCQGGTWTQLNEWFDAVSKVYPFTDEGEGWSFKPYPRINPENTARVLGFIARNKKVKRAHFLMTTGVDTVATIFGLGPKAGLEFVTYDSSSASAAGINRLVYVPTKDSLWLNKIEEKTRESKGEDRTVRNYLEKECECASCDMLRADFKEHPKWTGIPGTLDEYWKYRMIFHNTLAMLRVFDAMFAASKKDPEHFLKQMLGKAEYSKALRAFDGREAVKDVSEGTPRGLLSFT